MFIGYFFSAVFGLIVGSFLNVLTLRLMEERSFVMGRSACQKCGHVLGAFDLLPVLSFIWLRGQCRYCAAPISWQYPVVEFFTAVSFVIVFWLHISELMVGVAPWAFLRDLVFVAGYMALFIFDTRWSVVPDQVTIPLIVFGFFANLLLGFSIFSLLGGMVIGGGWFLLLWVISRGRWIGSGDIRLGILLGATLGLAGTALALYFAYVVGGIIAVGLLLSGRKQWQSTLPMGAFLMASGFAVLCAEPQLLAVVMYGFPQ